jgi:hypothetical protein
MGSNSSPHCYWLDTEPAKTDESAPPPSWVKCGKYSTLQPSGHCALVFKDERTVYRDPMSGKLECVNEFIVSTGGGTAHVECCRVDKTRRRLVEWYSLSATSTQNILDSCSAACVFDKRFCLFIGGEKAPRQISIFEFRVDFVPPSLDLLELGGDDSDAARARCEAERKDLYRAIQGGSDQVFKRVFMNHSEKFPSKARWVGSHGIAFCKNSRDFFIFDDTKAFTFQIDMPMARAVSSGIPRRTVSIYEDDEDEKKDEMDDDGKEDALLDLDTWRSMKEMVQSLPSLPTTMLTTAHSDSESGEVAHLDTVFETYPTVIWDQSLPRPLHDENHSEIRVHGMQELDALEWALPCAHSFLGFGHIELYDCVFVFGGCIDEEYDGAQNAGDVQHANRSDYIFACDPHWIDETSAVGLPAGASSKSRWQLMDRRLSVPMADCVAVRSNRQVHVFGSDNVDAIDSVRIRDLGISRRDSALIAREEFLDSKGRASEEDIMLREQDIPDELCYIIGSYCPFMHLMP